MKDVCTLLTEDGICGGRAETGLPFHRNTCLFHMIADQRTPIGLYRSHHNPKPDANDPWDHQAFVNYWKDVVD